MHIAFIGLGVMGRHMARHLLDAGHRVSGHDPNADPDIGIPLVADARQAVESAEVVLTMLPNGEVVQQVADAVHAHLPRGSLWIDCSSAEPWLTRATAAVLARRDVRMIDAPVSGAEWGARSAELVFMCGGEACDIERARPLLDCMGRAVFHLGALSSGHAMKAINNVITANIVVATAEAMQIGARHGLDPWRMVDVLDASTGGSWWSRERLRQDVLNEQFSDGFKLGLMVKDVTIAEKLASEAELDTPMLTENRRQWRDALAVLGDESAVTEMVRFVEQSAHKERSADAPIARQPDNGSDDP